MKVAIIAALAVASPAAAQGTRTPAEQSISITMTDTGFVPRRIVLRRGAPYALHVYNRSGKGHNLTQKSFFSSARVAPSDRGWVRNGQIVLEARERTIVRFRAPLTRPGGRYEFTSTTLGDAADDYKGIFVIR